MKKNLEKTMLLLICVSLISCITDLKSNNLSFDSEQWKNGNMRLRGQMSKNLEKSKILEGKTKDEVKNLIGEPFHINSMPNETENWSYKTDKGITYTDDVWIHWLHVDFSKQNEKAVRIYTTD